MIDCPSTEIMTTSSLLPDVILRFNGGFRCLLDRDDALLEDSQWIYMRISWHLAALNGVVPTPPLVIDVPIYMTPTLFDVYLHRRKWVNNMLDSGPSQFSDEETIQHFALDGVLAVKDIPEGMKPVIRSGWYLWLSMSNVGAIRCEYEDDPLRYYGLVSAFLHLPLDRIEQLFGIKIRSDKMMVHRRMTIPFSLDRQSESFHFLRDLQAIGLPFYMPRPYTFSDPMSDDLANGWDLIYRRDQRYDMPGFGSSCISSRRDAPPIEAMSLDYVGLGRAIFPPHAFTPGATPFGYFALNGRDRDLCIERIKTVSSGRWEESSLQCDGELIAPFLRFDNRIIKSIHISSSNLVRIDGVRGIHFDGHDLFEVSWE